MYVAVYYFANAITEGRQTIMSSKTVVRQNETIEDALRRFKRSVAKSGTLAEARKREYYLKPGVRARKKQEEARKKNRY